MVQTNFKFIDKEESAYYGDHIRYFWQMEMVYQLKRIADVLEKGSIGIKR